MSLRELTADDHARIRRQLVLIPVYLWLVDGWYDLWQRMPRGLTGTQAQFGRDFVQFYLQGSIANHHDIRALYDINAWAAMVPRLVPGVTDMRFPPVYGPQLSVFFAPLARLPYGAALALWLFLSVVVCLGCGYAVWKACPRLADRPWTVALLVVADPSVHFALGFAQISAIALTCVTVGFFALRANRPIIAGVAIGSLFYKPQLGLAAAFIFLFAGEWRIVLGLAAGVLLQVASASVFWGRSIMASYVASLIRLIPQVPAEFEASKGHMHSWRAFFELLGLPPSIAIGAYVVAAGVTLVIALRCWRARGPLAVRYSVFLLATVLVDPHMYSYDLVVLAPAFLLLWNWALEQGDRHVGDVLPQSPFRWLRTRPFTASVEWLLYFCYLSPLFGILAVASHVQLSVLGFGLLGLVVAHGSTAAMASRSELPLVIVIPRSDR